MDNHVGDPKTCDVKSERKTVCVCNDVEIFCVGVPSLIGGAVNVQLALGELHS